jgi:hypothetical protein
MHLKYKTYPQDARWQVKGEGYATADEYRKGVAKRCEAIVVPQDGEGDNRRESEWHFKGPKALNLQRYGARSKGIRMQEKATAEMASGIERKVDERNRKSTIKSVNVRIASTERKRLGSKPQSR